jgi:hypothetical protein
MRVLNKLRCKRQLTVVCCFVLFVSACDPVGLAPPPLNAAMSTDSAQVVVLHRGYLYSGNIGFTWLNDTNTPVWQPGCGSFASLEMKRDIGWVRVPDGFAWACGDGGPPLVIEPGRSVHFTYSVTACDPGHHCDPESVVPPDGTYRLRWDFREGRTFTKSARVVTGMSNEFQLIVQKAPGYVSLFGKFVCGPAFDSLAKGVVIADIRLKASSGKLIADNADVQRIETAGGEVLHRFNVELVRARISTDSLKSLLSSTGIGDYAIVVDDPTKFDVDVAISFLKTATAADSAAAKQFVDSRSGPAPRYQYTIVADSMIPTLSRMSGIKIVRARALNCEFDL